MGFFFFGVDEGDLEDLGFEAGFFEAGLTCSFLPLSAGCCFFFFRLSFSCFCAAPRNCFLFTFLLFSFFWNCSGVRAARGPLEENGFLFNFPPSFALDFAMRSRFSRKERKALERAAGVAKATLFAAMYASNFAWCSAAVSPGSTASFFCCFGAIFFVLGFVGLVGLDGVRPDAALPPLLPTRMGSADTSAASREEDCRTERGGKQKAHANHDRYLATAMHARNPLTESCFQPTAQPFHSPSLMWCPSPPTDLHLREADRRIDALQLLDQLRLLPVAVGCMHASACSQHQQRQHSDTPHTNHADGDDRDARRKEGVREEREKQTPNPVRMSVHRSRTLF